MKPTTKNSGNSTNRRTPWALNAVCLASCSSNNEIVELRQTCFTPGRVFEPGKYLAGELPDAAFDMGLVEEVAARAGQE